MLSFVKRELIRDQDTEETEEPVRPHSTLAHAGNFLYMLSGSLPLSETARDFDICLILHAEHSFNASTFAGREVASTHAHLYASIVAALGALSGELHGGANSEVMEMLLDMGVRSMAKFSGSKGFQIWAHLDNTSLRGKDVFKAYREIAVHLQKKT
jgi:citrate synthase